MLTRPSVPLHDEIPIFAELAAIRVSNEKVEPWQDDLYMPAIARPSSRQPPAAPEKLSRREPARDLAQRVLLGSADMRLWVIQRSEEDESSGEPPDDTAVPRVSVVTTELTEVGASVRERRVKAFLCHKQILSQASTLLRYRVKRASAATVPELLSSPFLAAESKRDRTGLERPGKLSRTRRFQQQKLRVSRPSLLEFELHVREDPSAFADILTLLYGMPLKVTMLDLKRWCSRTWWPALGLAMELQLQTVEAALRRILLDLPSRMPIDMTWAMLPLVHAHNLQPEMLHCSVILARQGAKCRPSSLPIVRALHVDALTALMTSDAWIVSIEAEIFALLQTWMKAQPWVNWSKVEKNDEVTQVPPEVFAASAKWDIKWGHLHSQLVEKLIVNGVVPETLARDIDRWRSSANIFLPPLPQAFAQEDRRKSQREAELRRGSTRRSDRKKTTMRDEELKRDDATTQGDRAVAKAVRTILSAKVAPGSSIPISPETTEWRTQSVKLHAQSPKDAFLDGMSSLCDAVDSRFGFAYLRTEEKPQTGEKKYEEEVSEEVRAARKLAGKLIAHIPPNCAWMSRRRCFHTELQLPPHPWQYFSKIHRTDRTTLYCQPPAPPQQSRSVRRGNRRSSGIFFEGNALLELRRSSTDSVATGSMLGAAAGAAAAAANALAAELKASDSFETLEDESGTDESEASELRMEHALTAFEHGSSAQFARLTSVRPISSGRHEFLFRFLVQRPSSSSSAKASKPCLAKGAVHAFAEAFQISTGIFTNPVKTGAGDEQVDKSQDLLVFARERATIMGSLVEVGKLKPEQMVSALTSCDLPIYWPPDGCFDCFVAVVLEPHLKEMRVAVDAAFTESLEAEDAQADAGDENASEVESEIGRSDDEARKVPILLSHFLQRRRFLRRWRFQDYLDQDLKNGIPLSNLLRGAGPNPLYLPTFHLDVEALCGLGGEGGSCTVELLPSEALKPSWWINLMGHSVDMPRPHEDSDVLVAGPAPST